jgi:hypothetical protein
LKLPLTLHLPLALPLPGFYNKNANPELLSSAKICAHHRLYLRMPFPLA